MVLKIKEIKINKQNICNSGEYYIASRLSAENFIVSITLGRAERYDILAVNPKGKPIKISVKSRIKHESRFPLSEKDEDGGNKDFYYAFILLNEFERDPDFWIIPSKRVNQLLKHSSNIWFNIRRKKDGTKYKYTNIRNLWIKINKTSKGLYPGDWEKELKGYYKNIKQLKII